jgi:phytoene/squalene synthetase
MKELFDKISFNVSKQVTKEYSTSFSLGIKMLHNSIREPIYAIYGFVRLADEIVDSFHDFNKAELLDNFKKQTFEGC